MTRPIPVEMKRVPPGATDAEREAMYQDYRRRLLAANPHLTGGRSTFRWLVDLFRRK